MSRITTQEIRGVNYRVVSLDPLRGGRLATRVGKLLAAALSSSDTIEAAMKSYRENGSDGLGKLLEDSNLLAALAGGVSAVDTDALYDVALEFARGNVFAGDRKLHDDTAFNAHFGEHPDHLLPVLVWVLRVNCTGFFVRAAAA